MPVSGRGRVVTSYTCTSADAGYGAAVTEFLTRRLRATPLAPDDATFFHRLWADERVGRTLGGVRDGAAAEQAVLEGIEHWATWGFGRWVLRAGEDPVGTVKLATCDVTGEPEVELGYAILPEFWGLGFATEAAQGALRYAREQTGLRELIALVLPTNERSAAVLARLGFRHDGVLELPDASWTLCRRPLDRL